MVTNVSVLDVLKLQSVSSQDGRPLYSQASLQAPQVLIRFRMALIADV